MRPLVVLDVVGLTPRLLAHMPRLRAVAERGFAAELGTADHQGKRRAAVALARKKIGLRYLMNVVGLDAGARAVRGSHGRLPADPADGPVLLCSEPAVARDRFAATEVKDLLLRLIGPAEAGQWAGAEAGGAWPVEGSAGAGGPARESR